MTIFQLWDSEDRGEEMVCVLWHLCYSSCFSGSYLLPYTQHTVLHTVPLLNQNQTILTINPSSDLFSSPILAAHKKIVNMGAKVIMVDPRASQDRNAVPGLILPDIDMFLIRMQQQHFHCCFTAFQNFGASL